MNYTSIIFICWLIFLLYWTISSFGVKQDIGKSKNWGNFWVIRMLLAIVVIITISSSSFRQILENYRKQLSIVNPVADIIGIILCASGVAFAIWARRHLGANWSAIPSLKEGHELATTGPYRYVRHPIYTGLIFMLLGTTLVIGIPGLAFFIILSAIYLSRIKKEEKLMETQFPDQ